MVDSNYATRNHVLPGVGMGPTQMLVRTLRTQMEADVTFLLIGR